MTDILLFLYIYIYTHIYLPPLLYLLICWLTLRLLPCLGYCKWSESEVAQSCLTRCDPMDCSLSGSSVHGIFQARVLEWIAISVLQWMLGCMYLFGLEFSSLLDICLVVVPPIYIPPAMEEGSLFSTPSVAFIICRHFDDSHSDWCEVIHHCNFYLHFSNN